MIANNSSGAHAPVYGTTADHIEALEIVLSDGTVASTGHGEDALDRIGEAADRAIAERAGTIRGRFPEGLVKRWPGYGLDRALRSPGDLTQLVAGSEGTLAGIASAVLRVVPKPQSRSAWGRMVAARVSLSSTIRMDSPGISRPNTMSRTVLTL